MTKWDNFHGSVAIIDKKIAELVGLRVGDNISVVTRNGTLNFTILTTADASWSYTPRIPRVVTLIVPLSFLQDELNASGEVNFYYVKAEGDADLNDVSNRIKVKLEGLGYSVDVEPAPIPSSPHGNVASIFSIVMIPSALIALVLIASILMNKVASEFRYFGVRKALGFTPRDVMLYVLLYSLVIYLLSVPVGLLMSYATTYASANMIMSRVIPFVIVRVDYGSVLRYMLYGLVATIIFSLYPAYRASRTNTLHAIQWGFEPQRYRKVTGESRLPKLFAMALRNITRKRRRSALIITILVLGGTFVVDAEVIRNSVVNAYTSGLVEQIKFDMQLMYDKPFNTSLIEKVSGINGVETVEALGVKFIHKNNFSMSINDRTVTVEPFSNPIIVFINKSLKLYTPELLEGRYPTRSGEIVISQYLHLSFGIKIGDKLIIRDQIDGWEFQTVVVGIARLLQQRGWEFVAHISLAYDIGFLPNKDFNSLLIGVSKGYDVGEVANLIVKETEANNPNNVILTETLIDAGSTTIRVLEGFMMAVTFIIIISALIGLVISFQMAFFERRWEIGLMKTLGGTRKEIIKVFSYEATIYSLISIPMVLILGYYTSKLLVRALNTVDLFLGVKFYLPQTEWLVLSIFPLIVAYMANIPIVKRALKIEPVKLLRETNI